MVVIVVVRGWIGGTKCVDVGLTIGSTTKASDGTPTSKASKRLVGQQDFFFILGTA